MVRRLIKSTSMAELDERMALRKAETELFQRLAKVVQPMALEPDEDDAAPITWFYAAMAKRTDIGRGFAAVMNHPETAV